jgi:hypothetical protein
VNLALDRRGGFTVFEFPATCEQKPWVSCPGKGAADRRQGIARYAVWICLVR